mgnify:CR=1 FL=1
MSQSTQESPALDFFMKAPAPINFGLMAQFSTSPDEDELKTALLRLANIYPTYGAKQTDSSDSAFPLTILDAPDLTWKHVVVEQLGLPFDLETESPIRLVLLRTDQGVANLIITFHHGVADGMAGVFFLQDLLTLLADVNAEIEPLAPDPNIMTIVPESVKNSFKLKISCMGMKIMMRLMWIMGKLGKKWPAPDRLIDGKAPWAHMQLTSRDLSIDQTLSLVSRCKAEETSVHAAISTAWLRARHELIPERNWKRTVSSPVNLRGFTGSGKAFGLVMSNFVNTVDCSPSRNFWDIARDLKQQMAADIASGEMYNWLAQTLQMVTLPPNLTAFVMNVFFTQPPGYDFSLTNLGRLNLSHAENVNAVYGPLVNGGEQEFTVGVSTHNNHLTMSFAYRDFVLSKENAEKMADLAVELLGEAVV